MRRGGVVEGYVNMVGSGRLVDGGVVVERREEVDVVREGSIGGGMARVVIVKVV